MSSPRKSPESKAIIATAFALYHPLEALLTLRCIEMEVLGEKIEKLEAENQELKRMLEACKDGSSGH